MPQQVRTLLNDTLYLNSFYLMAGTAVLAGFGFIFWLIVARLYATADIGLASDLISVMNFITYLSLIGFNIALVRLVPTSQKSDTEVNTGMLLVALASAFFSAIFILCVRIISPALAFVQSPAPVAVAFVLFCVFAALNTLTDAYFLAKRRTVYTLIVNALFSAVKVALPFFFIAYGALGIFFAAALSQAVGFAASVIVMIVVFGYRPHFAFDREFLLREWRYCAGNYTASIFNLLPVAFLPIFITNTLGAEPAAYFYMAMMIANLLYVIPSALTRSLFAEGANSENSFAENVKKAFIFMSLTLLPAIVLIVAGAGFILGFFGEAYRAGADFLRLLAVAGVFIAGSSVFSAYFQLTKNVRATVTSNVLYAFTVVLASALLVRFGLIGIGLALMAGSLVSNVVGLLFYQKFADALRIIDEMLYNERARIACKRAYLRARRADPDGRKTVLFYPDKPSPMHILYVVCHRLGYAMTNDPRKPHDIAIAFEDTNVRLAKTSLAALCAGLGPMINSKCGDISKERVGEIFENVFGYGTTLDPTEHRGVCVKKPNENATHKGAVISCPAKPDAGYVYQKLINNVCADGRVTDNRAVIYGSAIAMVQLRYRNLSDRFDNTTDATIADPDDVFSKEEQRHILDFCKAFGLEYGDLDILRDADDGRIYIVDVNNAPSGPRRGVHMPKAQYDAFIDRLCRAFSSAFVPAAR